MINKNFDDVAKISNAIADTIEELKKDEINIDFKDVAVNLFVNETELSIIDKQLYELTCENSNKEYVPARTVEVNVGGIFFRITVKDENKAN